MSEERPERPRRDPADNDLSRRAFVALSVGSGLAAATRSAGAALPVVETRRDDQDARRHLRRRLHPPGRPAPIPAC